MKRPTHDGRFGANVTTPAAAVAMRLLGPDIRAGSVWLTRDESNTIRRLYGYVPEQADDPVGRFMQAGSDRNAVRHAECDGLRMVTWIARFIAPGEDPLKALIQLAVDAGWDTDPSDIEWCKRENADEVAPESAKSSRMAPGEPCEGKAR